MSSGSGISRKLLGDALLERLTGLDDVTIYRGEAPTDPPIIQTLTGPDPSGRTGKYVVVYTGAGTPGIEPDVADAGDDLRWPTTLTLSAGYLADCEDLIDQVHNRLYRWTPVIEGHVCGRMKPPPGYDPGAIRRNDNVKPPRFWTPMQWVLDATTT